MLNCRPMDIRRDNRGQTLVEFALVVAMFLAILFGIIEFGRFWFYSNHLNNSVRAAARYGAVLKPFSQSQVNTYLRTEISQYMSEDDIDSITVTPASPATGDTITVTVNYRFTVLSASVIPYFNGEYLLRRTATMRFE